MSEEQITQSTNEQLFYAQQWKKHKRGCTEMIDMILESVDMNKKEFIKSLGLETDEDYGVDLKKMQA